MKFKQPSLSMLRAIRAGAPPRRLIHSGLLIGALVVVMALSACSTGSGSSATPTATDAAASTPTGIASATPAAITATPTSIATATPSVSPIIASGTSASGSAVTAAPSTSAGKKSTANDITGQLTAINGTTWTLKAKAGSPITVTITPQTVFGSKKKPEAQTDFTVGSQIIVQGQQTGAVVTATHVTLGKKKQ